jgi:hypothetical protein
LRLFVIAAKQFTRKLPQRVRKLKGKPAFFTIADCESEARRIHLICYEICVSFRAVDSKVLPDVNRITTSHVEKQDHTLRMHCRRLTSLTNAFSKKLENFEAAVALNFAYYNFCKTHNALRMTPAMGRWHRKLTLDG